MWIDFLKQSLNTVDLFRLWRRFFWKGDLLPQKCRFFRPRIWFACDRLDFVDILSCFIFIWCLVFTLQKMATRVLLNTLNEIHHNYVVLLGIKLILGGYKKSNIGAWSFKHRALVDHFNRARRSIHNSIYHLSYCSF